MEKGKGQGRSSLGAKAAGSGVGYGTKGPRTSRQFFFLLGSCSPLDLANKASYGFRYRDIFSFFPGISWVISSHAANSQTFRALSLFFLSSWAGSTPAACVA